MAHDNTGTRLPGAGTGTSLPQNTGTQLPGTGTKLPGTGTQLPGATRTQLPDKMKPASRTVGSLAMIPEYDEYTINGISYQVCREESRTTLSKKSGEAKIFIVKNAGNKFALKLYIPGHSPNHEILESVKKAGGGFFIKVLDHGKWSDPSHPGLTLDYEIMEYAPYGSLASLSLDGDEDRFRQIAWRMAWCLRQCHEAKIVHRDVKPENFLFTDSERVNFVLSDFGIARRLTGKSPIKVDTAKSSYFVSPEGSMSSIDRTTYVTEATDYYSMGMTLLEIWLGPKLFYDLFPAEHMEELDRLKLNNKVISEISDILEMSVFSRSLLERLLEPGDQLRAGFADVERWYRGELLKTGAAAESTVVKSGFRVVFDENKNLVAHSREELAKMMLADMAFAKVFLYKGLAKNALQGSFPRLAGEIDDIAQRLYPRPDEQETGVYAACLLLDQSMPFIGRNKNACTTGKQIAAELWGNRDYYSKELAKRATPFWAYLNIRGGEAKDLPEKYRSKISAYDVDGLYALVREFDKSVLPVSNTGKPLREPKDIADTIWENRDYYKTMLAVADHQIWTYLRSLGPNSANIANSAPARIKARPIEELYSICLSLDKYFYYPGLKGGKITTQQQLADELWNNVSEYKKLIADPEHILWRYMRTRSEAWKKMATSYPSLISRNPDEGIFDLIYHLDPKKPYLIQAADDRKWKNVHSLADIAKIINEHDTTDASMECLAGRDFINWLMLRPNETERKAGTLLEALVKKEGAAAHKRGWYLLYSIMPEVGLLCQTDKTKKDIRDTKAIGATINDELNGVSTPISLRVLFKMGNWESGRLGQFMEARKMSASIIALRSILNIQANINAHKSAPYTFDVACWKAVALFTTPQFYCFNSQKYVKTLDDVRSIPVKQRNAELERGMADFLQLFFHENVKAQFSFSRLRDYFDFLDSYCPTYKGINNSRATRDRVENAIKARDNAWRSVKVTRIVLTVCCLIPMVAVLSWMIGMCLSDGYDKIVSGFEGIGHYVGIVLAIICALGGAAEGGIGGAIVAGLLGYFIPVWIFGWISGIAPWLLIVAVVIGAIYFTMNLFSSTKDTHIPDKNKYDTYRNQAEMLIVCNAFGTTTRTFGSTNIDPTNVFEKSRALAKKQIKTVWKAGIGMIMLSAVTLVLGVALMNDVNNSEQTASTAIVTPEEVAGSYLGTFHGRNSVLTLVPVTEGSNMYNGEITIDYSTPMTQKVSGQLVDAHLILKVNDNSGADYNGYISRDGERLNYEGMYTNPSKGTNHEFFYNHDM